MNTELESLIISAIILAFIFAIATMGYFLGYRDGQIDASNGKQKYTLIEFPDGTRLYYKNPKPSDFSKENKNFKIIK